MTPSVFLLCLMCVLLWKEAELNNFEKKSVHQEREFISAEAGGMVTLRCSYSSEAARYYWYKQSLGQKLQLMSITYKYEKSGSFTDEFKDNPHFNLTTENGKCLLNISDLRVSDTGTYFCASGVSFVFEFGEGVTVSVKDSRQESIALIKQPESGTIQLGNSVTLNCTIQTRSCGEEHSVYWFRNSEEPDPGLIYTDGGVNDQCEEDSNKQTHTCVYTLPMRNLSKSHAGTYYCAIASCGQVLFGDGTTLDWESEAISLFLVYFLSAALIFTIILNVLLLFIIHKIHKRNNCQTSAFKARFTSEPNVEVHQDRGNLHYAAVNANQLNRSRRHQKDTETECVYSAIME